MSSQRYTPEFKDEALRQVVERGYAVADVAEHLGVSAHSPVRARMIEAWISPVFALQWHGVAASCQYPRTRSGI